MSSNESRKDAIQRYKNRIPPRGAFAVRCAPTGQVWVGASANLDGARNGLWFALRHGSQTDRDLQAAWTACGEAAFRFEVLETLDSDVSPMRVGDLLKQKKGEWAQRLGASTLL
jgi:hypothetical protein